MFGAVVVSAAVTMLLVVERVSFSISAVAVVMPWEGGGYCRSNCCSNFCGSGTVCVGGAGALSLYRHENFTSRDVKFFKKLFLYHNESIMMSSVYRLLIMV